MVLLAHFPSSLRSLMQCADLNHHIALTASFSPHLLPKNFSLLKPHHDSFLQLSLRNISEKAERRKEASKSCCGEHETPAMITKVSFRPASLRQREGGSSEAGGREMRLTQMCRFLKKVFSLHFAELELIRRISSLHLNLFFAKIFCHNMKREIFI